MNIIELVKEYVLEKSNEYKINSNDNYDFWNEHIIWLCLIGLITVAGKMKMLKEITISQKCDEIGRKIVIWSN